MIRIGFGGSLYYSHNKELQNSMGNYLSSYSILYVLSQARWRPAGSPTTGRHAFETGRRGIFSLGFVGLGSRISRSGFVLINRFSGIYGAAGCRVRRG